MGAFSNTRSNENVEKELFFEKQMEKFRSIFNDAFMQCIFEKTGIQFTSYICNS